VTTTTSPTTETSDMTSPASLAILPETATPAYPRSAGKLPMGTRYFTTPDGGHMAVVPMFGTRISVETSLDGRGMNYSLANASAAELARLPVELRATVAMVAAESPLSERPVASPDQIPMAPREIARAMSTETGPFWDLARGTGSVHEPSSVYEPIARADRPATAPTLPVRIRVWKGDVVAEYADWSPERYASLDALLSAHEMTREELGEQTN
jgi:hypothetical protein